MGVSRAGYVSGSVARPKLASHAFSILLRVAMSDESSSG